MIRKTASPRRFYLFLSVLFFGLAFLHLAVRDGDSRLAVLAGAVPAAIVLGSLIPVRVFSLDRLLTSAALTLCAFGILAAAASGADEAISRALRCAAAMAFLLPGALVLRGIRPSVLTSLVSGFVAAALLAAPLLMPYLRFHADEAALVLLLISCAALLAAQKQLPAMITALSGMALMLAGSRPVTAAVWGITFLLMLWAYSARWSVTVLSLCSAGLLFYGAWLLIPDLFTLQEVPALPFRPSLFGPEKADWLPGSPDAALLLLACRYGLVLAGCVFLLFPMMMLRGVSVARASRARFHGLLCTGLSLLLSLFSIGAMLYDAGIWPLQPIAMPFLSDDLPSLCTGFFLIGLISGISCQNRQDLTEDVRLSALSG